MISGKSFRCGRAGEGAGRQDQGGARRSRRARTRLLMGLLVATSLSGCATGSSDTQPTTSVPLTEARKDELNAYFVQYWKEIEEAGAYAGWREAPYSYFQRNRNSTALLY